MKTINKLGIILVSFGLFHFLFIVGFFVFNGIPAWINPGFGLLPPTEQGGYAVPAFVLFPFALEFSGIVPEFITEIQGCTSCYPLNELINRLGVTSHYIIGIPSFPLWDALWSVSLYCGIIILVNSNILSRIKKNDK